MAWLPFSTECWKTVPQPAARTTVFHHLLENGALAGSDVQVGRAPSRASVTSFPSDHCSCASDTDTDSMAL